MAYDRPSWKEIDNKKDRPSHVRRRGKKKKELSDHSTRYDKYKSDLNRLFDQGMVGELLKKTGKEHQPARSESKVAPGSGENPRKSNGRIPRDSSAVANRFKLTKAVIDAHNHQELIKAIDELVERLGLTDDWQVLVRILEHRDEVLILKAVTKMKELLGKTSKIPRRLSLKERLRTIGQTAAQRELRQQATELEQNL